MSTKMPITPAGFDRLNKEIQHLKTVERPAVVEQIAEAREFGDLSENAEYHAAREKQGFVEKKIVELENIQALSDVIDPAKLTGNKVMFGATVTVYEEETDKESTYQIVGEYEADLKENKISIKSPIARAMINKEIGEITEVKTPSGIKEYEIVAVKFN